MRYQIGQYIREQRLYRHMSLKQLSSICGSSVSYLSQMERNMEVVPDITRLVKIAKALSIPLERILMECGYLAVEPYDYEAYQILENFLMREEVKEKYQIDIKKLSPKEKQELVMHIGNALEMITYKYR